MNIRELTLDTSILSLGSILGTTGQRDLLQSINSRCGGGAFFGSAADPFREGYRMFMDTVVNPIRNASMVLQNTANALLKPDRIRPIDSVECLREGIPSAMHLPILYHPPVRRLLEEGRIEGFGYEAGWLNEEDPYSNALKSGYVELSLDTIGKNGEYEEIFYEDTYNPVLTDSEVDAIRRSREFLDRFFNDPDTKHIDPTAYPYLIG